MGKVIYVNFICGKRTILEHNESCYIGDSFDLNDGIMIEILDVLSGDYYLYFEDDMVDVTETKSFKALSKMIDDWEPSDFIKRF